MFKKITTINDVEPFVRDKKEIRFFKHQNGITIGCYLFMDNKTFDTPEALECRGIAFDANGEIVSRPLHKFFNVGEKITTTFDSIEKRNLKNIFEKIDGSMVATCKTKDGFLLRTKKSFNSNPAIWATEFINQPQNKNIFDFCHEVALQNWTAVFELMHPDQRIVIKPQDVSLNLLHVRDNFTGEYLLLNKNSPIHSMINDYKIPQVKKYSYTLAEANASLDGMRDMEGYVYQFDDGDMVKIKCDWYRQHHTAITFMRRRDIALASLHENLDDVKNSLRELGIDLNEVESIEKELKNELIELSEEIDGIYQKDKGLSKKDFAIKHQKHPLFGLIMAQYSEKDVNLKEWYEKNRLKERFGLENVGNVGLEEDVEWDASRKSKQKRI